MAAVVSEKGRPRAHTHDTYSTRDRERESKRVRAVQKKKKKKKKKRTHRHGRSDNGRSILLATLGGALILTSSKSLRGVLHDDRRKGQLKHLGHSGLEHGLDTDEGCGDFLNELDLALLAEELHANGLLGGFGGGAIAVGRGGDGGGGGLGGCHG